MLRGQKLEGEPVARGLVEEGRKISKEDIAGTKVSKEDTEGGTIERKKIAKEGRKISKEGRKGGKKEERKEG